MFNRLFPANAIGHFGMTSHRPALDALRQAPKKGKVRQMMVYALDGLGRSLRDLLWPGDPCILRPKITPRRQALRAPNAANGATPSATSPAVVRGCTTMRPHFS